MTPEYMPLLERLVFPITCLTAVAGFTVWLIKFILKENSKREATYQEIVTNHVKHNTDTLINLSNNIDESRKGSEEAHRYQREEHYKMIETLTKLNERI